MDATKSIGSGLAGALVLTALHESIKKIIPQAPRVDHVGMQLLKKAKESAGIGGRDEKTLYKQAFAGDMALNSLFYSMVGSGKNAWLRGLALGAGAGLAAVFLPKLMGVSEEATSRTNTTAALTIGLYAIAGLAAAGANSFFRFGQNGHG